MGYRKRSRGSVPRLELAIERLDRRPSTASYCDAGRPWDPVRQRLDGVLRLLVVVVVVVLKEDEWSPPFARPESWVSVVCFLFRWPLLGVGRRPACTARDVGLAL